MRVAALSALLFAVAAAPVPTDAQPSSPPEANAPAVVQPLPSLAQPALSPDGSEIAFVQGGDVGGAGGGGRGAPAGGPRGE